MKHYDILVNLMPKHNKKFNLSKIINDSSLLEKNPMGKKF